MEIPESVETINKRLTDFYGKSPDNRPNFRVVWSHDQFEKQYTNFTAEGLELLHKVLREVPKYRQYIKDKYILERLCVVPEMHLDELGVRLSYEPLWVFEDQQGFPLPPKWEVIVILIRTLQEQMSGHHAPYKQSELEGNTKEAMEEQVKGLQEALFGDDTVISDALSAGTGVSLVNTDKRMS